MSSYGSSKKYERKAFGGRPQGGKGASKSFSQELKLGGAKDKAWVRFLRGKYGNCEACGGYVQCDPNGDYQCADATYDDNNALRRDKDKKAIPCGHKGNLQETSHFAICYEAFIAGGGPNKKGAYVYDNTADGTRPVPSVLTSLVEAGTTKLRRCYAQNVLVYGTFHEVKEKKGEYENIAYHSCTGLGCQYCKGDYKKIKNMNMYLKPGPNHQGQIEGIDADISRKCANCDLGQVFPLMFICAKCGEGVFDLSELGPKEKDEQRALEYEEAQCPSCSYVGMPVEVPECLNVDLDPDSGIVVGASPGCGNAQRRDLFDVDVYLVKKGEGTASAYSIESWRPCKDPGDAKIDEPIDFRWLCDPTTEQQAKRLGIPNPFEPNYSAPSKGGAAKSGTVARSSGIKY